MAISINQEPVTYSPVYNPLVFVATSDNIGQPNFNYLFDVYWNSTLQTRHRIPARPDNGKAVFDASRVVESQLTHDIDIDTNDFTLNSNSFLKFQIKYGEEYDVAGVKTQYPSLQTGNFVYAYNACFDYFDYVDYDDADYLLSIPTPGRYLTNAPTSQNIRLTDNLCLYTIVSTPSTLSKAYIKVYDASGNPIHGGVPYQITNSLTATEDKFLKFPVGPEALNSIFSNIILEGYTYQVWTVNGTTRTSEIRTFVIDSSCTKYTIYRLHFLNQLGGFDAFNFTLVSKQESKIERAKYKKLVGGFDGSSYVFSKSDRADSTFSTTVTDSININSNWISESESVWLKELITSPVVFHELNGELIPITITENKYDIKKKVNEKLFNLSLTFNYSVTNNRQRY